MTNKLIIAIVAVLIVSRCRGCDSCIHIPRHRPESPRGGGELRVALSSFSAETLDPSLDNADGMRYHGHLPTIS